MIAYARGYSNDDNEAWANKDRQGGIKGLCASLLRSFVCPSLFAGRARLMHADDNRRVPVPFSNISVY
jgi:hypothetical protein